MAAVLLFFTLLLLVCSGAVLSKNTMDLQCRSAVGIIGQSTEISCRIEVADNSEDCLIYTVLLTKLGETETCFIYHKNQIMKNVCQFELPDKNQPSLRLKNTTPSDEGEYKYTIKTSCGHDEEKFSISVEAKYKNLTMNSWPEDIESGSNANLYCNASGGYPAGNIHWFDQRGSNWTNNSELQRTLGNDGLYNLFSKLSFKKFDSVWGPFRCVVLNSRYEEEEHHTLHLKLTGDPKGSEALIPDQNHQNHQNSIMAPAIVIGSLIVGLLMFLIFRFRRRRQRDYLHPENPTAEQLALCEAADENMKPASAEIKT